MATCDNVVINKLLCFCTNRISVLPRSIINRIVAEHFCEEDISTAKDVLYSNVSVPPKQGRIRRQGADKTKNNIDDIYKVHGETDPDALPIFIARDRGKLPSIDFNHIDTSTLSRDITACKIINMTLTVVCNLSPIQCPDSVKKCPPWCRSYHQQYIHDTNASTPSVSCDDPLCHKL